MVEFNLTDGILIKMAKEQLKIRFKKQIKTKLRKLVFFKFKLMIFVKM